MATTQMGTSERQWGRSAGAPSTTRQPVRSMTIIAQDPSVTSRNRILTAKVAIPGEDLIAGPVGYRVQVVDYDSSRQYFHGSHSLPTDYQNAPKAYQRGNRSIVKDFRFHAQNAYALVMKTLARIEFALGRRLGWSFDNHQIKIAPHGHVRRERVLQPGRRRARLWLLQGALLASGVYRALP